MTVINFNDIRKEKLQKELEFNQRQARILKRNHKLGDHPQVQKYLDKAAELIKELKSL